MTVSDTKIRGILTTKGTAKDLAKLFDVSTQTIWLYKRLEVKKVSSMADKLMGEHVVMDLWPKDRKAPKFSPEQVQWIRESTASSAAQAEHYGCSPSLIRMIKTGKSYA